MAGSWTAARALFFDDADQILLVEPSYEDSAISGNAGSEGDRLHH